MDANENEKIKNEIIIYLTNELNNVLQLTPRTNQFEKWIAWLRTNPTTMDIEKIRYKFYSSDHIKEIICEIDSNAYDDNKPEYVNALSFFKEIQTQGRIEELAQAIHKWENFPAYL